MVDQIKDDYRQAPLEPRTLALLDFAVLVAKNAHAVTEEKIEALRDAGLSDEDILNTVQIAGFFSYYNRMVEALGVEPESHW